MSLLSLLINLDNIYDTFMVLFLSFLEVVGINHSPSSIQSPQKSLLNISIHVLQKIMCNYPFKTIQKQPKMCPY